MCLFKAGRMKIILSFFLFLVHGVGITTAKELILLNWEGYMDPKLIQQFEEREGIQVKQLFFNDEHERLEILVKQAQIPVDLVMVGRITVKKYVQFGWLEPIGVSNVPNLQYIANRWRKAAPQIFDYAVPYMYGFTGIVFRNDKIQQIASLKQLFQPPELLRGKIHMMRDARSLVGLALLSLGYSYNSENPAEIKQAHQLLKQQRPFVGFYGDMDSRNPEEKLYTGEVWIGMAYNGAGSRWIKNKNISWVIPQEGTQLWMDNLVVMKRGNNKESAYKFLNFLNEPQHAVQLSAYLGYSTPNQGTQETTHPPSDLQSLPPELLEKSHYEEPLPPQIQRLYNEAFADVTRQ